MLEQPGEVLSFRPHKPVTHTIDQVPRAGAQGASAKPGRPPFFSPEEGELSSPLALTAGSFMKTSPGENTDAGLGQDAGGGLLPACALVPLHEGDPGTPGEEHHLSNSAKGAASILSRLN